MIVIDASITVGWMLKDEITPAIEAALQRVIDEGAVAPAHWKLEVANSLRTAFRHHRIELSGRHALLSGLGQLNIQLDDETNINAWGSTVELSDRHGLTTYDAAYLELAVRRNLPLATLDGDLIAAARADGVEVLP